MIRFHDDWDEADDDPVDEDDDAEDDLDECPRCGRSIYGDSAQCPRCGHYASREELPARTRQPWWVQVAAIVCLAMVVYWVVFFY